MVGTHRLRILVSASLVLALSACASGSEGTVEPAGANTAATSASGPLAPQPLAEPAQLTVTMGAKAEVFSPVLLADAMGEFAKENITIEYAYMLSTDSLPALARGQADVSAAGITATMFNGIAEGADIRLVYPGPSNNTVDGLWVRKDQSGQGLESIDRIGNSSGAASTAVVPISEYLASVGKDITDIEFVKLPLEDLATGLSQGVFNAAWLNSPMQVPIQKAGTGEKVVSYASDEFGTGYLMGPNLLEGRPEVGQAFVRALARTAATYLSGDYKADPTTVEALATVLEITPEELTSTPSLTFGRDMSTGLFEQAQGIWLELGDILSYDTALQPDAYVDTTYLDLLGDED